MTSYGHLGQQRSGSPKVVSANPKTTKGSNPPRQTMRGYGGAASRQTISRGRDTAPQQKIRGFKKVMGRPKLPTRNVSANRIKKGRA